jgi:hypothetical protein
LPKSFKFNSNVFSSNEFLLFHQSCFSLFDGFLHISAETSQKTNLECSLSFGGKNIRVVSGLFTVDALHQQEFSTTKEQKHFLPNWLAGNIDIT